MIPIKALKDDEGHWYIIPNEKAVDFYKDLENTYEDDGEKFNDEFNDKYGQYRTGGDLNLIQLYIKQ
jgi:hypothetical protein